jgi:hypothetical protein
MADPCPQPRPDGAPPQRARAYCGDAHHQECIVSGDAPPQYLDLPVPTGTRRYRLVRHPRTGVPARDPGGALIFVPARQGTAPTAPAESVR